jgi:hypothetical protein
VLTEAEAAAKQHEALAAARAAAAAECVMAGASSGGGAAPPFPAFAETPLGGTVIDGTSAGFRSTVRCSRCSLQLRCIRRR